MRYESSKQVLKLVEVIGPLVDQENLMRLAEGDLSHIGNAILEGKPILVNNKYRLLAALSFNLSTDAYSIGEQNEKTIESVDK